MGGFRLNTLFVLAVVMALTGNKVIGSAGGIPTAGLVASPGRGGVIRAEEGLAGLKAAQMAVRQAKAAQPNEPWTVVVPAGEIRLDETLAFGPEDSGRPGAPIVWKGTGVCIRGGIDLGPWSAEGEGVVSAAIPKAADGRPLALDMLFVNGERASRSILPKNRGSFKIPGGEGDSRATTLSTNAAGVVTYAKERTRLNEDAAAVLDAVAPDDLPYVQLQVRLDWTQARRRVVGWDRATREVLTEAFGGKPRDANNRWCERAALRFENVRAAFVEPGEWFYDAKAGKILYRLRPGETAATLRAVAPANRLSKLLTLDGTHDVRFEGFTFEYADAPQGGVADDPRKNNQTYRSQSAGTYDATVEARYAARVEFVRCRVARSGNYAFRLADGCRHVALRRCETWDTGAGGVWIGSAKMHFPGGKVCRRRVAPSEPAACAFNVVEDCRFRHGGRFNPEGTAVFVTHASDCRIEHNEIDDWYYSGITVGYTWGYSGSVAQRNVIAFNRISRLGQRELSDMGGIYTLATSFGTVVSNNVISEVFGYDTAAWGLYADEGSEGIVFENNVVSHTEFGGMNQHYGSGCVVRNNIIAYNDARGCLSVSRREAMGVPSNLHVTGNIFYTHKGPLICRGAMAVDGIWAHNVWWKEGGTGPEDFDGRSAEAYLASGRAYGDVVADPIFVDAKNGDFRLRPDSPALKLGFREWDTSLAGPRALVSHSGEVGEKSGWRIVGGEAGKVVYIPFEGYYESKGGRLESPRFALDKDADENAWYEFSFTAKSPVDGFWWVDVFDADGKACPDMNSRLLASADWRAYRVVVSLPCGTAQAQLAFVATKGVAVRDVSFRRISVGEAAAWCRKLYRTLPQEDLTVPADAWARLPLSRARLVTGKPIRILLLGDSIVNDTWCGNVSALICERYPNAKLSLSVRGSTGCWFYRDPENFKESVLRHKPDLVLVGGISNGRPQADYSTAKEDLLAVIRQAREAGIEIGVMSPPPSYEFRKAPDVGTWSEDFAVATCMPLRRDYQRAAVREAGVAYFDLTTAPCDAIATSGKPLNWFKRDRAHNDDRGKQLIAQRLAAYFLNP